MYKLTAMKKTLQLLLLIVLCTTIDALAVENYLNTPNTLNFDNTAFTLGWSSHPREIQYLQEYFPKGQSPENFKDMLSVWVFVGDFPAKQYIQNMANNYEERKKTDKSCNYQIYENDGEYMFDCLLSEDDGKFVNAVEFNIYRCKNTSIDGKQVLLICFYSQQAKGDDIMPFLTDLKELRGRLILAMAKFEYPQIKLSPR